MWFELSWAFLRDQYAYILGMNPSAFWHVCLHESIGWLDMRRVVLDVLGNQVNVRLVYMC